MRFQFLKIKNMSANESFGQIFVEKKKKKVQDGWRSDEMAEIAEMNALTIKNLYFSGATVVSWRVNNQEQLFVR